MSYWVKIKSGFVLFLSCFKPLHMNIFKGLFAIIFLILTSACHAQVQITLRKSFIDSMKDRISYTGEFVLVAAPENPHPAAADGDLHMSCMEKVIGLPIVAEIINAKDNREAVHFTHFTAGTDREVKMTGVWRIWAEHATKEKGDDEANYDPKKQVQGAKYKFSGSNPAHVFEIHPVLQIGGVNCMNTLKDIEGYSYKAPEKAFAAYANARCSLTDMDNKILISTNTLGFNYAEFWLKPINEGLLVVADGRFVTCDIYDGNGAIIANNIRVGFPKGSEVENAIMNLNSVEKLHVMGLPRLSLHDVANNIVGNNGDPTDQPLPYEMIAITTL